ncbi:hypothetical protein D3C72_1661010 [compost metagenome]
MRLSNLPTDIGLRTPSYGLLAAATAGTAKAWERSVAHPAMIVDMIANAPIFTTLFNIIFSSQPGRQRVGSICRH